MVLDIHVWPVGLSKMALLNTTPILCDRYMPALIFSLAFVMAGEPKELKAMSNLRIEKVITLIPAWCPMDFSSCVIRMNNQPILCKLPLAKALLDEVKHP